MDIPVPVGVRKVAVELVAIKAYCRPEWVKTYRAVLYSKELSNTAKMLAFVMLDSPMKKDPNFSVYARKMGITNPTLSKARRELQKAKVFIFPPKLQENDQPKT